MKYYTICNNNLLISDSKDILERFYNNVKELPIDYESGKYIIVEVVTEEGIIQELVLNPNWEEEKAKRERARIDGLKLTPSDVERALYYSDLNMDFDDLKTFISEKAPQIDLKGLAIEFRANNFYRSAVDKDGNRIVDMIGLLLGYTPEDMDYLFEYKELPNKGEQ